MSTPRTKSFTVGAVSTLTDTSPSTLRLWELQKLIPPPPRSGDGRRQYGPEHVELIREFKRTRRRGRPPRAA